MAQYDNWIKFWITDPVKRISEPEKRLDFLYEMQRKFHRENTDDKNIEVRQVKEEIKLLIEQELQLMKTNPHEKSNISKSKKKEIKSFPELFTIEERHVAEICSKVFGNSGPKQFAIMFCLLTDKKLLNIPNNNRSEYYISWYHFIDKILPNNNNFWAINKHIADKAINGFVFKDETDSDYNNFKDTFLKEINKTV